MVVRAKGINCEVELFDHHILIKRTGLFAAGSRLGGDKSVPLSSITSVQFRRAGMFSPGFIKLGILGEADPGWDKLIHPNVVGFRSSQQMAFQRIRDAIQASINVPSLAVLASQHVAERHERLNAENSADRLDLKRLSSPDEIAGTAAEAKSEIDWDAIPPLNPSVSGWLREHKVIRKLTYMVAGFLALVFLLSLVPAGPNTASIENSNEVAQAGPAPAESADANKPKNEPSDRVPALSEFVGQYPSDKIDEFSFWTHPAVSELVGRVIEDPAMTKMILGGGVEGQIGRNGEWIRAYACMPHNCAAVNWGVLIKADGSAGAVCYHNEEDSRDGWYDGVSVSANEGDCMPANL